MFSKVNETLEPKPSIPAWEDIKFITSDLKNVLDNFVEDDDSSPIPVMRARLARAIAEMRDEKGLEDRVRVQLEKDAIADPFKAIRAMSIEAREKLRQAMNRK